MIHPKAKTGAHHHGPVESVIYVVSGRARMRWGDKLEFVAEAGPGDFTYAAVCAASGDQRERRRAAIVRARAQRSGAGRRQPRHPGRRKARRGALGGQYPPGAKNITARSCSLIDPLHPAANRSP